MKCSVCNEVKSKLTKVKAILICCQCLDDLKKSGGEDSGSNNEDTCDESDNIQPEEGLSTVTIEDDDCTVTIKQEPELIYEEIDGSSTEESIQFYADEVISPLDKSSCDSSLEVIQIKDEITIAETEIRAQDESVSCQFCGHRCATNKTYRTHLRVSHPEDRLVLCKICHLECTGETLYRQHVQEKHEGFGNLCKICLEQHPGTSNQHRVHCLGRLLFNCKYCNKGFGAKETIWNHLDDHYIKDELKESSFVTFRMKERFVSCKMCEDGRVFRENIYWEHVKEAHPGMVIQNEIDDSSTDDDDDADTAEEISPEHQIADLSRPKQPIVVDLTCHKCSEIFSNRRRLEYHEMTTHQEPKYHCQYCPRKFHVLNSLQRHVQSHQNERKFRCDLCGLSYNTQENLARHNRSYHPPDGVNVLKCKECRRKFKRPVDLENHMKLLHGANLPESRKYSCEECNLYFASEKTHRAHLTRAFAHKEVKCKECKNVFPNARKYDEHIQSQTCYSVNETIDLEQSIDMDEPTEQRNSVEELNENSEGFSNPRIEEVLDGSNSHHANQFNTDVVEVILLDDDPPYDSNEELQIQDQLTMITESGPSPQPSPQLKDDLDFEIGEEYVHSNPSDANQNDASEELILLDKNVHSEPDEIDMSVLKDEITIEDAKFDDHAQTQIKQPKITCYLCAAVCTSHRAYMKHLKVKHPESENKSIRCKICHTSFTGQALYNKHIQEKHEGYESMCKVCLELLGSGDEAVNDHNNQCLGRLLFGCNACSIIYAKKESLWKHLDVHDISDELKEASSNEIRIKDQVFTCIHCEDEVIYRRLDYWQHIKDLHNSRFLRCEYCTMPFKQFYNRSKHMERCSAGPAKKHIKCPICLKTFPSKLVLRSHKTMCKTRPDNSSTLSSDVNSKGPARTRNALAVEANLHLRLEEALDASNYVNFNHLASDVLMIPLDESVVKQELVDCNSEDSIQEVQTSEEVAMAKSRINTIGEGYQTSYQYTRRSFRCKLCNFNTLRDMEYRAHLRTNHPETRITRCNICFEKFKGETLYRKHIQEKHEGFDRKCTICLELYSGTEKEHKNKNQCSGRTIFNCKICAVSYSKKESLWHHLDDHNILDEYKNESFKEFRTTEQLFSCVHCEDNRLYSKDPYEKHLKVFHKGRSLRCAYCTKSFKFHQNRLKHMGKCESAPTEGDIECPDCPKTFPDWSRLNYHKKTEHHESNYRCQYCSKKFHDSSSFQRHVQLHKNERKFHCSLCSLSFNIRSSLAKHNRTYHYRSDEANGNRSTTSKKRKFECMVCEKSFKHQSKLETHMKLHRLHHRETPKYYCEECNVHFTSNSTLQSHLTKSIAHAEVECKVCSVFFPNARVYDEHIRDNTCKSV